MLSIAVLNFRCMDFRCCMAQKIWYLVHFTRSGKWKRLAGGTSDVNRTAGVKPARISDRLSTFKSWISLMVLTERYGLNRRDEQQAFRHNRMFLSFPKRPKLKYYSCIFYPSPLWTKTKWKRSFGTFIRAVTLTSSPDLCMCIDPSHGALSRQKLELLKNAVFWEVARFIW